MSPLSKITNPENCTQIKLVKDHSSSRKNDLLKHNTILVNLPTNLLKIRDTDNELEIQRDFSKMITNKNCNIDLAKISDKK